MSRSRWRVKNQPGKVHHAWRGRGVLLVWATVVSFSMTTSTRADDLNQKRQDAVREQMIADTERANAIRNFEVWVFGQVGNAEAGKTRLNDTLSHQIARIDRVCRLTEAQKKKLFLSGHADIKHFFDRYEETKARIVDDPNNDPNMLIAAVNRQAQPLRQMLNGLLFEQDSLFQKILVSTLDSQQLAKFHDHEAGSRTSEYRSHVAWMMLMIDRSLGMTSDQRARFHNLVIEETRIPKHVGTFRQWVMFYQISTVPEEKLKPIFDDLQWSLLQPQLARAKMLKPTLVANGFVPADDPARAATEDPNLSRKD